MDKVGDILSIKHGIVVQGCNAQGKMNSGLAKQIRAEHPEAYDVYKEKYDRDGLKVGEVVWSAPQGDRHFWIANAITQKFYGRDPSIRYVDYDGVRKSLQEIAQFARANDLYVHLPRIGAGLGNGDWSVIRKIIDEEMEGCKYDVWTHPSDAPPTMKM